MENIYRYFFIYLMKRKNNAKEKNNNTVLLPEPTLFSDCYLGIMKKGLFLKNVYVVLITHHHLIDHY